MMDEIEWMCQWVRRTLECPAQRWKNSSSAHMSATAWGSETPTLNKTQKKHKYLERKDTQNWWSKKAIENKNLPFWRGEGGWRALFNVGNTGVFLRMAIAFTPYFYRLCFSPDPQCPLQNAFAFFVLETIYADREIWPSFDKWICFWTYQKNGGL